MGEMGVDTAFLFRKRFFIEKLLCIIWIGSVPLSALGLTECSHPKPDRFDVDEITHVRQRTGRVQDTDRLKNAGPAGLLSQRFYAPGDLTIKKLFGYAAKIRVFSFMVWSIIKMPSGRASCRIRRKTFLISIFTSISPYICISGDPSEHAHDKCGISSFVRDDREHPEASWIFSWYSFASHTIILLILPRISKPDAC